MVQEAMKHCRYPVDRLESDKAQWPTVWQRMIEKRQRRFDYAEKHGSVPNGWTPPDPKDGRTYVRPMAAWFARAPRRVRRSLARETVKGWAADDRLFARLETKGG